MRPGKDNHGFNMSPLLKYRRPHKKSPYYRIIPYKSFPGRQFIVKNPSRRAGWIFAGKLSAGGDFAKVRSYNGTPASV